MALAAAIVVWRPFALGFSVLIAPRLAPPARAPHTEVVREAPRVEPTRADLVRQASWPGHSPDSAGVWRYANSDYHPWVFNDARRVWYHFVDR